MLSDSLQLNGVGRLQRLRPELSPGFGAAFAATEVDLRQWMPAAAKEQEDHGAFIDRCVESFEAAKCFAYAIVAPNGDIVGYVNLTSEDRHAVIGYWVHPEWRGRGLAPLAVRVLVDAAFAALSVDRIHAHLDAANTSSRRVLTKAGFTHHETYTRPPRTESETNTEWLFVRHRYPGAAETAGLRL